MLDSRLRALLAAGATIVTPNKRLARAIAADHDAVQRELGVAAWPAARALPWATFVDELWKLALDAALPLPPQRLDAAQCRWLWRGIVARDLASMPLIDADAAAALAAEAWELVHAYGTGGMIWRGFGGDGGDPAAFARWAEAFMRETNRRGALDAARATDALVPHAAALRALGVADVVCAGFQEIAPAQARLLEALRRAAVSVVLLDDDRDDGLAPAARLAASDSPDDDIARALAWARERALAHPAAAIGIVVLDLAGRRALVRTMAEDTLCPALQWPGRESVPRPYDISAGEPLAAAPMVSSALDLIAIAHAPLEVAHAATLLRSPFLPDADRGFEARAALERTWLEAGVARLSLRALLGWLDRFDAQLASRWSNAMDEVRVPARASPRVWAERWRAWLDATGWCEGRTLSSAEYQAKGAWSALLTAFVRLGAVAGELSRDEALAALRRAAADTTFQPEASGARVIILGALEAAGLSFDALWVAGCTAEAWPQAPAPNPLLPPAWQRAHGVPRSHAARELDYARRLTARLSRAAPEVVFSFARSHDGHPCAPSPLVAGLPLVESSPGISSARTIFSTGLPLESIPDFAAPPVPAGTHLQGGAGMIDAQSACPFKAMARYRLDAREWPAAAGTLDAAERGRLIHAALEGFWRDVHDQHALVALADDTLDERIGQAVDHALASLPRERWEAVPAIVAAGEGPRIAGLVRQWLLGIDRVRPPFSVVSLERDTSQRLRLGDVTLDVKFDRLDAFADGSAAIVDYKTGHAVGPAKWFEARPQAPQLALYALALRQGERARPLAALAYGQIRPGDVRAVGLVADATRWPGLIQPMEIRTVSLDDWNAAMARLQDSMLALSRGIAQGDARVAPRDADVCKRCHLQAVCRIASVAGEDEEGRAERTGGDGDA